MVLIVLDRRNSSLLVANKLQVVIHLNCVCNTVESMLESISLVRVCLLFGTNYRLGFLMRLQLMRLLQSFARAIVSRYLL